MIAHPHPSLVRETIKSVAAGLVGATVPALASLGKADVMVVHAMHDVAVGLAPTVFLNALMSALIPAVITLRREARHRRTATSGWPARLLRVATLILGLAAGATIVALSLIDLTALAFSVPGLAATGVLLVRAMQAVLVAAILTPLTITLLSSRSPHTGSQHAGLWPGSSPGTP